jgi:putative phosphoesterase
VRKPAAITRFKHCFATEVEGHPMIGSPERPPVIGVVSDTHGLLRPEVVEMLKGVSLILHAGDIGTAEVLERLQRIAPVFAVRGNNDKGRWAARIPESQVVAAGAVRVYMLHNLKEMAIGPSAEKVHAVVSGHSHKPSIDWRDGMLFLNPGSAGPRRFKLPVSLARMFVQGTSIRAELIEL